MRGGQAARDVVRGQERAQGEQVLGGGCLLTESLDRDGPGGGDRPLGRARPAQGEQFTGARTQQGEVFVRGDVGLFQVGGGLVERLEIPAQ
jgi:hypothetical protein